MKTFKLLQMIALITGGLLSAQLTTSPVIQKTCENFNHGAGNWKAFSDGFGNRSIYKPTAKEFGPSGQNGDYALNGEMKIGNHILFNNSDFKGNLIKSGSQLTFDFKVIQLMTDMERIAFPKLYVYKGDPTRGTDNFTLRAVYEFPAHKAMKNGWMHVSIPFLTNTPNMLGEETDGRWRMIDGSNSEFNKLLEDADGIYFDLNIGNVRGLKFAFDNICINDDADSNKPPRFNPLTEEILSDGAYYCSESRNLLKNGNFENGNNGFKSFYEFRDRPLPGQFTIFGGLEVMSHGMSFPIKDHSYCTDEAAYSENRSFMVVNGLTNQVRGSNSVIYDQIVDVKKGKSYNFGISLKHLPQPIYDVIPQIQIEFNHEVIIPYYQIDTNPYDACDWETLVTCYVADSDTLKITVRLKEDVLGDGNDLAIDDISLQEKKEPDYKVAVNQSKLAGANSFRAYIDNPTAIFNGCNEFGPYAGISDYPLLPVPYKNSQYYWFVSKLDYSKNIAVPELKDFAWSDQTGKYGDVDIPGGAAWELSTTFSGYHKTGFEAKNYYLIGMYIPSCCESCTDDGWSYQVVSTAGISLEKVIRFELDDMMKANIIKRLVKNKRGNIASEKDVNLTRVYPNPGPGLFNVSLEKPANGVLEVYNLSGVQVHHQSFDNKSELKFDISSKPKGIYVMKINVDGYVVNKQLVVK